MVATEAAMGEASSWQMTEVSVSRDQDLATKRIHTPFTLAFSLLHSLVPGNHHLETREGFPIASQGFLGAPQGRPAEGKRTPGI